MAENKAQTLTVDSAASLMADLAKEVAPAKAGQPSGQGGFGNADKGKALAARSVDGWTLVIAFNANPDSNGGKRLVRQYDPRLAQYGMPLKTSTGATFNNCAVWLGHDASGAEVAFVTGYNVTKADAKPADQSECQNYLGASVTLAQKLHADETRLSDAMLKRVVAFCHKGKAWG